MGIEVCKDYTLTVGGTDCYAYFKCNEAAPCDTLVDSVAAFNLARTLGSNPGISVAGKISNAVQLGVDVDPWVAQAEWDNGSSAHWGFDASFTIRFWYKPSAISGGINQTVLIADPPFGYHWYIERQDEHSGPNLLELYFYVDLVGNLAEVYSAPLTLGAWNHVVFWYEAGVGVGVKVNNGAAVLGTATEAITPVAAATLSLFSQSTMTLSVMDEIAIWKRKLTDAEITTDYNAGAGRTWPNIP